MVNWVHLQNATSPDNKPTPGWLFNEVVQDVRRCPKECPDVAEYLMQCVCCDQLNIQLKAVLCIKHLASEDVTFQQYMQACQGALKILDDIAAPPLVPQARSLEPQDVKTVREATATALSAIRTQHTIERSTEAATLKRKIQGFGNYEPPREEEPARQSVVGQAAEFVGDSVGDMVDDFREKGAVIALKDATIDALDLVLDGVDAIWGWVAGKSDDQAPRICQPAGASLGAAGSFAMPGAGAVSAPSSAPGMFAQPPAQPARSASNHYAVAFGGGVVGANNPVHFSDALAAAPSGAFAPAAPPATAAAAAATPAAPAATPAARPAPTVDLLSMDEPPPPAASTVQPAAAAALSIDLLDGMDAPPAAAVQPSGDMLDF